MITMRISHPDELQRQKEIWKMSFEDDDQYADYYFSHFYHPERMFVLEEDGEVKSMLATYPMQLHLPDGSVILSAYVYGLCTDPKDRKRGFGRQLLGFAEEYMKEHGVKCVVIVPADMTLFLYYDVMGYRKCFAHRRLEVPKNLLAPVPEGAQVLPVEPNRYNEIRDGILKGSFYISYNEEMIEHQRVISRMEGADIYEITVDGVTGVAAAEYDPGYDGLEIKELVIPEEKVEAALAALAAKLPADTYFLRVPAFMEDVPGSYYQTFGVVKWLDGSLEQKWGRELCGYMGIAYD